ncbi:MAG TPA: folylpolyglutamate synthase/dihydrofolate synthase family protein [Longimicrobiales bacterium]|nr:folylpolyglutamate synthase/dihydrofolate synthase family protein [Longimicrobiales bacterium]
MSEPTYAELIRELFPRLAGGVRWGLERTEWLLESVGSPHLAYRTLHIAGTNGKGSVAATAAALLSSAGYRTGLYTSPHVCTFRERMQVDGRPISEEALLAAARRLWPLIQESGATFFEATTAIAFLALADAGVEWAVVEVGLGGRLDSTNVLRPEVSVVTNVALDHAELLGRTRLAIAREKAGIIKAGVPIVTAETDPAVLRIIRERAASVAAPFHVLDPDDIESVSWDETGTRFTLRSVAWGGLDLATPLIGRHQAVNTALAVRALELLPEAERPSVDDVRIGVSRVRWPGRVQIERIEGVTWVFDGAHNPAAAGALASTLEGLTLPRPLVLVVGILADKNWAPMLSALGRGTDHVVLTVPPSAPPHRRWDPELAAPRVKGRQSPLVEPDFSAALSTARSLAGGGTILVTGSLHTVGDALLALGRPPADDLLGLGESAMPSLPADAARV